MAKKNRDALCCQINQVGTCGVCLKKLCEDHAGLSYSVCKSNKCYTIYVYRATEQAKALELQKQMQLERMRKDRRTPTSKDISSSGYRLLKKIESRKKK